MYVCLHVCVYGLYAELGDWVGAVQVSGPLDSNHAVRISAMWI